MSYDIALWHEDHPVTTDAAGDYYRRLAEDEALTIAPCADIDAFIADLTAQFPTREDTPDKDIDSCPWNCEFERSAGHVVICIASSRLEEVMPLIGELAARHDLVCYNPQWPAVTYPPRIAAMPHRRLTSENWTLIDNPTNEQITATLELLNADGNSFALLEITDMIYLQTRSRADSDYIVEYQAGSLEQHFQATIADLKLLASLFHDYADGNNRWHSKCDWERLDL
jgi:hypothetical protein